LQGGTLGNRRVVQSLSEDERERLTALSKARDEPEEAVLERFGRTTLARCPRRFSPGLWLLRSLEIAEAGTRDKTAWLRMPNGRVFYGYLSHPKARREYAYIKDIVPAVIDEDTFLLAQDIAKRYATAYTWPPAEIAPPRGGTVVEAGAYLGHKTIRFVDECLGPKGRMLAIEMVSENIDLLRRNIAENGLQHVIDALHVGVWRESGQQSIKGKGRQRYSLTDLPQLGTSVGESVPVKDLDSLLEEWGEPIVDLLYISVNGAEIEALHGLVRTLERVRALFIVAPYQRDGRPSSDICREMLAARRCTILPQTVPNQVAAWGPAASTGGTSA